ncbi:cob(I)yrinic acid a,c-diamide adenosyltransferase [Anaerolineales bacterium HSG6]|nr:cob(I)yrinic acid a,c-diamide adenosyltransferase [Anaerolineales bacterium HSG6]
MPKQTILYTRRGDDGYTSLLGKEKVLKHDLRPEAYGTVDEASAFMGLARANPETSKRTKTLLLQVQRDLWVLMGELATAPTADFQLPQTITAERVLWLEAETDKLGAEIPALTQFVIPGDTMVSAWLEVARTVIRRAERAVTHLASAESVNNSELVRYLNRLSSLLFALARYEEMVSGETTTLAKK